MPLNTKDKREQGEPVISPHPLISKTIGIANSQPRISGTDIRVSSVVELSVEGLSIDDIIAIYSDLDKEKILAALEYHSIHS